MTTKAPSAVQEFQAESIEKKAYASVSTIQAEEPNDLNRLGYHVWRWITTKQGTLEQAIAESGARIHIPRQDAAKIIRESLAKQGVTM